MVLRFLFGMGHSDMMSFNDEFPDFFFYGKYQLSWKEEMELVAGFSCARSETDWSWEPTPFRMRTDNSSKRLQESSIEIHTMTTVTVHKSITKVLES